jgi:hypothetical protein
MFTTTDDRRPWHPGAIRVGCASVRESRLNGRYRSTMQPRKGPISAADLMREREEKLRTDPEYRAQVEAVEAERSERVRALREAEQPIVADLNGAGVSVDSVWDLVNTSDPYPVALPILLDHLERGGYPDRVMESLGRALAVKPSVAWWNRLRALYLAARNPGEEDGTAVALAACATKAQLDDLINLVSVEQRGESRIYFVRHINRLGGARGLEVLESLRHDATLGREATAALAGRSRNR